MADKQKSVIVRPHVVIGPPTGPNEVGLVPPIKVAVGPEWDAHLARLRTSYYERQVAAHHVERWP